MRTFSGAHGDPASWVRTCGRRIAPPMQQRTTKSPLRSRPVLACPGLYAWVSAILVLVATALSPVAVAADAKAQALRTVVRVAVKPIAPFVIKQGAELSGFSVDLWSALAQSLKVDTAWVEVASVNEQLQAVRTGKADAAIAAITITQERDRLVDFTHPYFDSGLQILVRTEGGSWLSAAFDSFPWSTIGTLLGAFLAVMFIVANVLWLVERRTSERFRKGYLKGVGEGLWGVALIVATGEHGDREGSRVVKRLVVFLMWLVGVVLIAQLTATISSTQTVARMHATIHGPNDLAGKRVVTVRGTVAAAYLTEQGFKYQEVASADEACELVLKGEAQAMVFDAPTIQYLAMQRGKGVLQVVGPIFEAQKYGIAVPDGSPLRKRINDALLKMYEDGRYQTLYAKWFSQG
ncbi:transporter substrate-binding domain-containing protein [Niveibacterium sp. SC-1]|uniref:transporter substrate-binding domain-containing protein n=1 Tax=Niveibacterium sp. SC-1 TaxID=3135646 RepID=UPI003120503A